MIELSKVETRSEATTALSAPVVEKIRERARLVEFLKQDPVANAYMLGHLDPLYFPFCRWFGVANGSGGLGSLLCVYNGLSLPVAFMSGTEHFRELLLGLGDYLPRRFHFHVLDEQMEVVRDVLKPVREQKMLRMVLDRQRYAALRPSIAEEIPDIASRLNHRDTAAIMATYEHYPDHLFEPYQLETGLYFGVRDEELGLASIAGVHVVSVDHEVAVIGNFVTHPERRGHGLSTACTLRLLDELFERVPFVALNVQDDNAPAIHIYEKFGFETNNVFFEGRVGA